MDIYKNVDSEDFNMTGTIKTFEKEVFEFTVEGECNKDLALQPAFVDEQEHLVHDTRFFKDFLDGDISYTFKYKIKGREGVFQNMQELMLEL